MKWRFFDMMPLLPLAVCLAVGILAGSRFPALSNAPVPYFVLLVTVVLAVVARRRPLVQSAALWLGFVAVGLLVTPQTEIPVADGVPVEAVVVSAPAEKPKTVMVDLLLLPTSERRRCYIWKDSLSRQLTLGQSLVVALHDRQFVWPADWRPGGDGFNHLSRVQRLRVRALRLRNRLASSRFRTDDADAQAVLSAMVLGDKSALSRELRQTYSVTGASHVLALSGLHLSIIYLLLTRLTLGRRRFWLSQVLVVLAIWAFALLTGLSPSLVRAATMLTVYSLFALGGRRHSPLGVLSFTAIVMLLADSRALFDVGFQLSFMAVLAILLFVPLMERFVPYKWLMSHRLLRWVFSLMAVSLAAQLGTAPLVAYYFGRLPVWFLLTNLLVVPAATLILYGAAVALLFPPAGPIVASVVMLLNGALDRLSRLPLASIGGLHPSPLQVSLAYVAVAALGVALHLLTRHRQEHPYYI